MCIRWFFNIVEQNTRCDNKNNLIQFLTTNSPHIPISVASNNNIRSNITNIKFLRIMIIR
jgi:hypothetical protein